MQVYCTSCGTPADAEPGAKVMCTSCTAVFEVPKDMVASPTASAQQAAPRVQAPLATSGAVPGTPLPGLPAAKPQQTNVLAILSLVSGMLCCVPFLSLLAVGLGVVALNQLKANPHQGGREMALSGIILGSVSMALNVLFIVGMLLGN